MGCIPNFTGETKLFGGIVFPTTERSVSGSLLVKVICDCGAEYRLTSTRALKRKSVACRTCLPKFNVGSHKHGKSKHPLYALWDNIKRRCRDKNNPRYGGRGIRLAKVWNSFDRFLSDIEKLGERPPNTSLDRVDNDGHYEPGNVRWASAKTQRRNQGDGSVSGRDSNS